jgi:uncharacterized damage-inducible protein DinB
VSKSIVASLEDSMGRTDELARSLDDESMSRRLQDPSNTVWDQFWCMVGARESYARAITSGEWVGFACSLTADDRGSQQRALAALQSSRDEVQRAVSSPDSQEQLILDLLLHETQHHGQLIRYVYGLGLEFPKSWRERWNL